MHELASTALTLTLLGVLMALSVLGSRIAGRIHVPVALLFLGLGMAAGAEGIGGVDFEDYALAFRLGTVVLVLILFDGGLRSRWSAVRPALAPSVLLATAGVVLSSALVALAARALGFVWGEALLLGVVVSSTDAAAVFAVLRGSRIALSERVAATLELESGLNDPVAVMLTIAVTAAGQGHRATFGHVALDIVVQLVVGGAGGLAVGYAGRWLVARARPTATGLLPVLTVALALFAFGATTLLHGSGFLAAYVAGIVLGNAELPDADAIARVHDSVAWLGQVVMFLVLGLLSFPSRLLAVGGVGLALGLALA
ncbi:MAG TPA: cation:proton antiporter, partial [Polyangia bacterium]